MKIYYNENDKFAVKWLFELMKQGAIPKGEIDDRSIKDVSSSDVESFDQAHFFAGIGGWAYALEIAEWGDRPIWTGSCPCQPFSIAGRRKGNADERDLWPYFRKLIEKCQPPTVFGEQVESPDGRLWFSGVRDDLEKLDYAVGAADLCAAGVGSPNRRQRLYWMAYTDERKRGRITNCKECNFDGSQTERHQSDSIVEPSSTIGLAESGLQGRCERSIEHSDQWTPWQTSKLIQCIDGRTRRVKSGIFPLANGVPARVGRLRGYGNAINPYVAAEFIAAFMDIESLLE